MSLYDRIVDHDLLIRRLNITTNNIIKEAEARNRSKVPIQLDLFTDYEALEQQRQADADARDKERRLQEARLHIKERFGKNAILKGLDFEEGATTRDRNKQIGGHKKKRPMDVNLAVVKNGGGKHWTKAEIEARAAQFAPFAALTGHYAAIDATARRVASKEQLRAVADDYANDYTDMLSDIQPDND